MNLIVEASNLPISIIIIGVGPADFKIMQYLGDHKKIKAQNGARPVRACT